jgi:DNA processing protein
MTGLGLSDELRDLLALTLVPGLGPRLTAALLERFGSATAARNARSDELRRIPHIGETLAFQFAEALRNAEVEAEIVLLNKHGVALAAINGPDYPAALATIVDAPQLLYLRGSVLATNAKAVAIVGSRQCTAYGRRMTERIAGDLARAGFTIVSGLARGIDGSAHRAALEAGGRTIAVLAGGLSAIYPPEHADLADEIAAAGALLSETPMAMQPQRGMFHARNRLISGLSRAVVIVEANERSGALITARHAAEQGREVFAVPGNVDSATSAGSLALLRSGARLIRHADDLLEDLEGIAAPTATQQIGATCAVAADAGPVVKPEGLEPAHEQIWQLLSEAKHIDQLTCETGLPVSEVGRHLMQMEMKRLVRRLPGNSYERRT